MFAAGVKIKDKGKCLELALNKKLPQNCIEFILKQEVEVVTKVEQAKTVQWGLYWPHPIKLRESSIGPQP